MGPKDGQPRAEHQPGAERNRRGAEHQPGAERNRRGAEHDVYDGLWLLMLAGLQATKGGGCTHELLPSQLTLGPKQTQLLQGLSAYGKAVPCLRTRHEYRFCGPHYVSNGPDNRKSGYYQLGPRDAEMVFHGDGQSAPAAGRLSQTATASHIEL
jgi:hypothetical protein